MQRPYINSTGTNRSHACIAYLPAQALEEVARCQALLVLVRQRHLSNLVLRVLFHVEISREYVCAQGAHAGYVSDIAQSSSKLLLASTCARVTPPLR